MKFSSVVMMLFVASCASPQPDARRQQTGGTTVGQLAMSPKSATLVIGDTLPLRATMLSFAGDTVATGAIEWRSDNVRIATVSEDGVVRAKSPGLTGVSARQGSHVAVTRIIVAQPGGRRPAEQPLAPATRLAAEASAPEQSNPGSASPSGFGNEPAGFTMFVDRNFRTTVPKYGPQFGNDPRYAKKSADHLAEGWSNTEGRFRNFSVIADATAPSGDGMVGQMFYPAGMRSGVGPASATYYLPPNTREVYISFWMKLSANWHGNQSNTNKMFFFGVAGGNSQFIFNAYGSGTQGLQAMGHVQGILDNNAPGHGHLHRPNLGRPSPVNRGQWQRFEFVFRCNSAPGRPDGSMEIWNDGVKVFEEFDTNWTQKAHPTRPCDMNVLNWNPTYGGGGAGVPYDMYQWVDRVYISGR